LTPTKIRNKDFSKWPQVFLLLLMSTQVQAAEALAWKSYLFAVMGISVVVGGFLSLRNPKAESRLGKLLLAGLYFWVLTFAQLIVLALIYYLNK